MFEVNFSRSYVWLITGVAGFIGSHLLEFLLNRNQKVVGVDNFSTGSINNIDEVLANCSNEQIANFFFYQGDICDLGFCKNIMQSVDIVLHQAALGSIPRSIKNPITTHNSNVNGMLNLLVAAKENEIKSFVYASSSSVYGDSDVLPRQEHIIGHLLSPYAASKYINELYADIFSRIYGLSIIGLRYFNVFGPRQNKNGAYAAVIPRWISGLLENKDIYINGDGTTSRDFTYISNAVQINILAAQKALTASGHSVYNTGAEKQTNLINLFKLILQNFPNHNDKKINFRDFRPGDVKHSFANIELAKKELNYVPTCAVEDGIKYTVEWFLKKYNTFGDTIRIL